MQQPRNELEQSLPQYARDQLDRHRAEANKNAAENPAIMEALNNIIARLVRIEAALAADGQLAGE